MNTRAIKILLVLLSVLLVVYFVVGRKDDTNVESVTVGEVLSSSTSGPATLTPTLTSTPTPTVRPTNTSTPTVSPSPTPKPTETATMSLRKWAVSEVGTFISFVGSWFWSEEISFPQLPREGDEVVQLLTGEFVYSRATDSWSGPAERVNPDAVCAWAFEKLGEGYGLVIIIDGKVVDEKTREERWYQFASVLGNPNIEPYCPQFDLSAPVPVFNDAD